MNTQNICQLRAYYAAMYNDQGSMFVGRNTPRVVCSDGFSFSVQASAGHYCTPREDFAVYTEVEVGYPSREEPTLMPYVEDADRPTDTVYPYVPVEVLDTIIQAHGGFSHFDTKSKY